MQQATSTDPANDRTRPMMQVWDLPTRLFHWSLVAGVGIAFVTGFIAPEWWMGVHKWSGYAVVALIAFRVVWGLFGPEYSRFDSLARTSLKAGDPCSCCGLYTPLAIPRSGH